MVIKWLKGKQENIPTRRFYAYLYIFPTFYREVNEITHKLETSALATCGFHIKS